MHSTVMPWASQIGTEVCSGLSTPPWGQQTFGERKAGQEKPYKKMKLHKSETHSRVKHGFFTPIHDLQDINLVPLSQYCSIMFDTFSRSDKTWVACSICAQVEEQWHKTQIIYIYISRCLNLFPMDVDALCLLIYFWMCPKGSNPTLPLKSLNCWRFTWF